MLFSDGCDDEKEAENEDYDTALRGLWWFDRSLCYRRPSGIYENEYE